jgi:hypothetical protein
VHRPGVHRGRWLDLTGHRAKALAPKLPALE